MKTAVVAFASLLTATNAFAQGSLSVQGFGYPPGQLSTRAEAMGGGVGELDQQSAVNPASISGTGTASLYIQYDPEFRTVTSGGLSSKTTTARFPIVGLIMPVTSHWNFGLGASTLVDRSSLTRATRTRIVGPDTVRVDERTKVLGAIDDLRLALGWSKSSTLKLGVGAHLFTGTNQVTLTQTFPDSAKYSNFRQSSRLSYTGAAISVGAELHPSSVIALGLAARKGGALRAEAGDTLLATANAPDHFGASLSYTGWGDATIAFRLARDQWSSMQALMSSGVTAYDSWDIGGGAEAAGPRIFSHSMVVRLGLRDRTLPFSSTGSRVTEMSASGGIGLELARGRASLDAGLLRANRTSGSSLKEHAYILSIGLRVTP